MKISAVVENYSTALFEIALKKQSLTKVIDELSKIIEAIHINHKFKKFMLSTSSPYKVKSMFMQTILQTLDLSQLMQHFIGILLQNNRIIYIEKIKEYLEHLINKHNGVTTVLLKTAVKPDSESVSFIKINMEKSLHTKVIIKSIIDKRVLGGMMLQVGSKLLDCSAASQLNKIRQLIQAPQ